MTVTVRYWFNNLLLVFWIMTVTMRLCMCFVLSQIMFKYFYLVIMRTIGVFRGLLARLWYARLRLFGNLLLWRCLGMLLPIGFLFLYCYAMGLQCLGALCPHYHNLRHNKLCEAIIELNTMWGMEWSERNELIKSTISFILFTFPDQFGFPIKY